MSVRFPEPAWLEAFAEKLNSDETYSQVAKNWEGDLVFAIEADETLSEPMNIYLDLWHGKCRQATYLEDPNQEDHTFVLIAPYGNFVRVLKGELPPMQAMMTRKLRVKGNMVYMMRNLPTVLEFVRCAQDVTTDALGD